MTTLSNPWLTYFTDATKTQRIRLNLKIWPLIWLSTRYNSSHLRRPTWTLSIPRTLTLLIRFRTIAISRKSSTSKRSTRSCCTLKARMSSAYTTLRRWNRTSKTQLSRALLKFLRLSTLTIRKPSQSVYRTEVSCFTMQATNSKSCRSGSTYPLPKSAWLISSASSAYFLLASMVQFLLGTWQNCFLMSRTGMTVSVMAMRTRARTKWPRRFVTRKRPSTFPTSLRRRLGSWATRSNVFWT